MDDAQRKTGNQTRHSAEAKEKNDSKAERVLNEIVPPSQDVTDDKLKDPGRAVTDDTSRVVNKS
jgi:hypothetical protein